LDRHVAASGRAVEGLTASARLSAPVDTDEPCELVERSGIEVPIKKRVLLAALLHVLIYRGFDDISETESI
jgi:hypothetical protein